MYRLAAHQPAHRRVAGQALGVVHVLVSRELPEHRLPEHADHGMPAVPAATPVLQHTARQFRQAERVIKVLIGQQSTVRVTLLP